MPKSATKKDANAPKRPASAYLIFSNEVRESVKAANPEATFAELNKAIGAKWATMDDAAKAKYNAQAEIAKKEYVAAHAEYLANKPDSDDDEGSGKKRAKKAKDPNAPKKPLSSYMIFAKKIRSTIQEENPEASFTDIGRLIGKKWSEMSDEEKKPFADDAAIQKEEYQIKLDAYNGH